MLKLLLLEILSWFNILYITQSIKLNMGFVNLSIAQNEFHKEQNLHKIA